MVEAVPAKGNVFGIWITTRYIVAVLGCMAMTIDGLSSAFFLKSNDDYAEQTLRESTRHKITSGYFWGYILSQIPGGRLSDLYSAKWVTLFAVSIDIVCIILTSVPMEVHYVFLIILRVLQGIGGGVMFPAMHSMLANWAPPNERGIISAIVYAGSIPITRFFIGYFSLDVFITRTKWNPIFFMAGLCCIFIILWLWLIQDTPNKQALISQEERDYINKELGVKKDNVNATEKKQQIPWRKVFTSLPFLAILISHICSNWGWYMFLMEIPSYLEYANIRPLKFYIKAKSIMFVFTLLLSTSLYFFQSKGKINTTISRKIATLIASVLPLFCVLALYFIKCQCIANDIFLYIGIVCMGGMYCGFFVNHIDIAPNYGGTLMALTSTTATIFDFINHLIFAETNVTELVLNKDFYQIKCCITVALFVIEIIMYTKYGSGVQQPWNNSEKQQCEENPLNDVTEQNDQN